MFKCQNGQFTVNPPAMVVYNGYKHTFTDLTREQWDEIGYNEAMPIGREPYTTYETEWVKGDDFIYREVVVTKTVNTEAMAEETARRTRVERDTRLAASDWTQVLDCPLDDTEMVLWQSYRQALRDVPQQAGFPDEVEWPEKPAAE